MRLGLSGAEKQNQVGRGGWDEKISKAMTQEAKNPNVNTKVSQTFSSKAARNDPWGVRLRGGRRTSEHVW